MCCIASDRTHGNESGPAKFWTGDNPLNHYATVQTTPARIHPTAIIEDGVSIGSGTAVWDSVHMRTGARVGRDCIIGEKTYIAPDVVVGDRCKLNVFVYVCTGVTIEDGVMVAANVTFTNDRFPRATTPELDA